MNGDTPSIDGIGLNQQQTWQEPVTKKPRGETPQKDLAKFVVVFENAPGALATVKRRRKLDPPVRKAARDVRKAGACHQCRFRKRTVCNNTHVF